MRDFLLKKAFSRKYFVYFKENQRGMTEALVISDILVFFRYALILTEKTEVVNGFIIFICRRQYRTKHGNYLPKSLFGIVCIFFTILKNSPFSSESVFIISNPSFLYICRAD